MDNQIVVVDPDLVTKAGMETNMAAAENASTLSRFNQAFGAATTRIAQFWPSALPLLNGYQSTFAAAYQTVILHQTEIGDGLTGVASLTVQTDGQVANQIHGLSAEITDLQGAISGNLPYVSLLDNQDTTQDMVNNLLMDF